MFTRETRDESPAVSLMFGLLAVAGLLYTSALALSGPVSMGVLFGGIELIVAWQVTPPIGAHSLRGITTLMGVLTVVVAVGLALAS